MRLGLYFCALLTCCVQISFSQGFTEIAGSIGLNYGYSSGDYGGGVSFVDFNQDGLDDLTMATGNSSSVRFHVNEGSGLIEIGSPISNITEVKQVLWVDYDNDQDLDLYVTSSSLNRLYKNIGDLNFVDITETCGFSDPVKQSFCGSWLDYDRDGLLDLCISHRISHLVGDITLYHNLGGDNFEDVTISAGLSGLGNSVLAMAAFDLNNDGWEDIYVGQDFDAGNVLLKNNGDGTFDNISVSSGTDVQNNTMTTTIGDYNGDGFFDIYVTNTAQGNSLYKNNGDETFTEESGVMGVTLNQFTWGAVFFDADNDMDLDLHVNGIGSSVYTSYMFENPGTGAAYNEVNNAWGFGSDDNYSVGIGTGDYDEDGYLEMAKNNSSGDFHTFWINDFTGNNYLKVKLQSSNSNYYAVGAKVHVYANGIHQVRRVGCGEGFSSQNSYVQHFGMSDNLLADSLIVEWPNGLVSTLVDVAANQTVTILESPPACDDSTACNYDPGTPNPDPSLCTYPGCTDIFAVNYDSTAGCDDGLCLYYADNCPADLNNDGIVDVSDLLMFLGAFGSICP